MTVAARGGVFRGSAGGGSGGQIDEAEVRRAVALLFDPAHPVELRGLPSGRSYVRRGDAADELVECARKLGDDRGVYWCLNPVSIPPGADRAASKADVVRRRWLLVDVDPVRPVNTNSSREEHDAARSAAGEVLDWLAQDKGWPLPVMVDSGNGWHLLYRVDLPPDDAAHELLKGVLKALKARFDTASVQVDGKVHNVARISKLPGTWARKGANSPERPHRLSKLWHVPGQIEVVTAEQLGDVAGEVRAAAPAGPTPQGEPARQTPSPFVGRATGGGVAAYARRALELEVARVALAVPGELGGEGRNNALNRAAFSLGQFVGAGLMEEGEVVSALEAAARACGLSGGEVTATIWSGLEAGKAKPRQVPDGAGSKVVSALEAAARACALGGAPAAWEPILPIYDLPDALPFPMEVFPQAVRRFVNEAADAISGPADFIAVPALSVASGAVGNSRRLFITGTHQQPALLFTCVVGLPGTGKSPALDLATAPLEAIQRERGRKYLEDRAAYEKAKEAGDDAAESLKPGKEPRVLVDDATREALIVVMAENPRGVLMVQDELAALIKGMDQYRAGGKGNDRQNFLKLWSQSTIRNDRKNNPNGSPVTVYRPFLAICGGTQPGVVASMRGDGGRKGESPPDDGLIDRFLFSYPAGQAVSGETWREVSEAASEGWRGVVEELMAMPLLKGSDGWGDLPARVNLTDCGKAAWQAFTDAHAAEMNDDDFPDFLRGPWSKLRGYCGRLGLVVHCLREACGEDVRRGVDGESMRRATLLADYFKSHARKVLQAMDSDPAAGRARRILRWLVREGKAEFKRHEVFRDVKNKAHFPRAEALEAPLAKLVKHNYLRLRASARATGGRPEAEVYEVHPDAAKVARCDLKPKVATDHDEV